ncbi:MAG: thioredoxin-disulfide reductase [Thermoplasmatota archaeon]
MADDLYDLAIIGGGPAGYTAGIYAGRSGLKSVILEKAMTGGQMALSYLIENWPGEEEIAGQDISMKMRSHAEKYCEIREFSEVQSIEKEDIFTIETSDGTVKAKAVILATGAEHRKLGIPGEDTYNGKGVSYCATCDGFFFKGKKVFVVGGGNTALEYAIYLQNVGCRVSLIHRRDEFRAEKSLQDKLKDIEVNLIMDSVVEEISGDDIMKSITVRNVRTGEVRTVEGDGIFVAIGEIPNNELAAYIGLDLDDEGYVRTDRRMATSVPGVYAAGDLAGGLKQIIIAAAGGAQAATSVFEDLMHPYWIE